MNIKTRTSSVFLALFALVMLAFSACSSIPNMQNSDRSAAITSAMLEIAGTSFAPVLANNPDYIPVAQIVADALGSLEVGEVNGETIRVFVVQLAVQHKFTSSQRAYAELVVSAAWSIYTAQTGNVSAQIGDANVKAWIASFRRGLISAIAISGGLKG